mmetsp:Transcript_80874/g.228942  ORF Transcript_80874/g.228942 Transcript_80874/m.228942 type:complete len:236 (+) Transcript_80874:693-1400(+)
MQSVCLPVDVVKADLSIPTALPALVPPRGEVRVPIAVYLHPVEPQVHLRRGCLPDDAGGLPDVLRAVLQGRVPAVDLEPRCHVGAEAGGEVQQDEKWDGLPGLLEVELLDPALRRVRAVAPAAGKLCNLEVAGGLAHRGHDAPNVKVHDLRLRVDDSRHPTGQLSRRRVPGCAAGLAVARVLLAPAQDVAEVVRRTQRHLRQGGKKLPKFFVGPGEAIASILQAVCCPLVVGLER